MFTAPYILWLGTLVKRPGRLHAKAVGCTSMIIGDRLRAFREEKKFSQGDIEKRTGLMRCYISRVENGHTVPAIRRRTISPMG